MKLKQAFGFLFVISLAALAGCSQLKEKPVVDFVMKDFKAESAPNCTEDSACAIFQVQYPEFMGIDTTVNKSISEKISYILSDSTDQAKSMQEIGNDFIKDFNEFAKDEPGFDLGWYFRGQVTVLISSDTLISLQVDSESFTGGAHSTYSTNFVNVEPTTGTQYLLDALLRPGYQEALNELGEEELRNQMELGTSDSLALPEEQEGKFQLTDNYGFRKEGIVFYFNAYELGSFSDGPIEVLIPYEKLRDWMK